MSASKAITGRFFIFFEANFDFFRPTKLLKSVVKKFKSATQRKNLVGIEKDDSVRALRLNFGVKNVERIQLSAF